MDKKSKWIWKEGFDGEDLYCDFTDSFVYSGGEVTVKISADSNYALYINGELAESGQYADFPHYRVYDVFDISHLCRLGENRVAITVWHYGHSSLCYYPGKAALRYEVWSGGKLLCYSSEATACRESREYQNRLCKQITSQMGYSFHYDATGDDGWRTGEALGFSRATVVDEDPPISERPVKKLLLGELAKCRTVKAEGGRHFLFDIGYEEVGYLKIKLNSAKKQKITITYGEHILDGCVRRIIGDRDFSVEITVGEGETTYMNPYRRLGLRYLEVFAEHPIEPEYISVVPVYYPLKKQGCVLSNPLDKRIYEVCVRTLELCMHEHYEDCPWREQALYCMDSRNQMLCGYHCFDEYEFPRACLKLMSEDDREDGLLSICFPTKGYMTKNGLAIPSFSLHFFTQVREYIEYSRDLGFAKEIYPKLCSVMQVFIDRMTDGCVPSFVGKEYWNFYEWSDGLVGTLGESQEELFEASLNLLFIIALRNMGEIARLIGAEDKYSSLIESVKKGVRERFLDKELRLFCISEKDKRKSELVNGLAILAGVCEENEARKIADTLASRESGLVPITLSMLCFKYDALLMVDKEKYKDYILENMREKYKVMLDHGATTFWETEDILDHAAGSHCHGWSALPVFYYEMFEGKKTYTALVGNQ